MIISLECFLRAFDGLPEGTQDSCDAIQGSFDYFLISCICDCRVEIIKKSSSKLIIWISELFAFIVANDIIFSELFISFDMKKEHVNQEDWCGTEIMCNKPKLDKTPLNSCLIDIA